jgi:hypothetical protein
MLALTMPELEQSTAAVDVSIIQLTTLASRFRKMDNRQAKSVVQPGKNAGNRVTAELYRHVQLTAQQTNGRPVSRLTAIKPVPDTGWNDQQIAFLGKQFENLPIRMQTHQYLTGQQQMNFDCIMAVLVQAVRVRRSVQVLAALAARHSQQPVSGTLLHRLQLVGVSSQKLGIIRAIAQWPGGLQPVVMHTDCSERSADVLWQA